MANGTWLSSAYVSSERNRSERNSLSVGTYDHPNAPKEPTGPLCKDPECEQCRAREARGVQPEVDHKVWRKYLRAAIDWQREQIREHEAELIQAMADAVAEYNAKYPTSPWMHVDMPKIAGLGELKWSRYAGCNCGCSPGFKLPFKRISLSFEWIAAKEDKE